MAAANMKAVKLRIRSVQNTMQITKAMELVASSKLRKAKEKADQSRPYLEVVRQTLTDLANGNTDFQSPYTRENGNEIRLFVVVAGDRGLAGGYNANLFRYVEEQMKQYEYCSVLPVGKKCLEYFRHRDVRIFTTQFVDAASVGVGDCFEMARIICESYRKGDIGHVQVCYTNFVSMLSQVPTSTPLLPLSDFVSEKKPEDGKARELILYEPSSEEVFNSIVPEYLAGLLYTGIKVSVASEQAARRMAMEAATDNAQEMIDQLNLFYNRARQASITQEITEIVAGAEET